MLTVGAHANSLLQGLQMSGHGSPQNHMMTAMIENRNIRPKTRMGMHSAPTMNNINK